MSETKEIDHYCTDDIVCPHCGTEYYDHGDWFCDHEDMLEHICGECHKEFRVWREFSVSYTSEIINTKEGEQP